jgi:hypothetical protein
MPNNNIHLSYNDSLDNYCADVLDASVRLYRALKAEGLENKTEVVDFYHTYNFENFGREHGRKVAEEFRTKMKEVVALESAAITTKDLKLKWDEAMPGVWNGFEDGAVFARVLLNKNGTYTLHLLHDLEDFEGYLSAEDAKKEADGIYAERQAAYTAVADSIIEEDIFAELLLEMPDEPDFCLAFEI